jgi:hypothetical protein
MYDAAPPISPLRRDLVQFSALGAGAKTAMSAITMAIAAATMANMAGAP